MTTTEQTPTQNVVALAGRHPALSPDCFDTLSVYWSALCTGRIMPDRKDVDPRGLTGILDKVFLAERIAPAQARFRVAGQHLVAASGTDLRGMPLTCLVTPASRAWLEETMQAVFDEPSTVDLALQGPRSGLFGRVAAARLTMFPLRGPDSEVTRIIGCLSSSRAEGKPTQRFDIVGESRRTLIGYGRPWRHDAPVDPEFAAAETARERIRHRKEMRGKLRVVGNAD